MISESTVLILGAGASMHLGYPSGRELVNTIIQNSESKTRTIHQLHELGISDIQRKEFTEALKYSGRSSIDAFLEHRTEFMEIGKLAIAQALIPTENIERLFTINSNWYEYLFQLMNTSLEEFPDNKLSVITFNYDRSLDTYLFTALKNSYGLSDDKAYEAARSVPIVHVHGQLGALPWEESSGRDYGDDSVATRVQKSSKDIKIIHENVDFDSEFSRAHEFLNEAKKIIFIGFGYNYQNMERLKVPFDSCERVQGSCMGFTNLEVKTKEKEFPTIEFGGRVDGALDFLRKSVAL